MEISHMVDASNDVESMNKNAAAGRWTSEEHNLFIMGLQIHNKQWKNIADMVKTRTVVQIRTHAQKYFQKLEKSNPSGAGFQSKSMSDPSLFVESNSCDVEDGNRMTHYRAHSIGSTDSADSSKYGRSVSLGSDGGNDSDLDRNSGLISGGISHCASFPNDLLINSYMNGVDIKPRSATLTDMKTLSIGGPITVSAVSAPKKRSRDNANRSATSANPPKSPKRVSHKNLVTSNSHPNMVAMNHLSYVVPPIHHSPSECDELDMISLLEKIDWNAIPSPPRSQVSSPFTDSAASLSSGSGPICYKSVLNQCVNGSASPLQFSHIDQVHVNEELTDCDVFDVFDEYYRNLDMGSAPKRTSSNVGLSSTSVVGDVKIQSSALTLVPVIQEAKIQPRVWFSSSVIGELKTKVQPGFSIGHGILKPWRDRKPVSQLPPLHSLTSSSPPVVIATQSLTLLDSTFCNYPQPLYQQNDGMELLGGYVSDNATTTSGGSSHSNSAYCIGASLDSPSIASEDVLGSPKTFISYDSRSEFVLPPQSPAVKKRGRPRKNSASSIGSTTVKSRSCSNLSASNAPIADSYGAMPSYPSFPNIGSTVGLAPPDIKESRSRKNNASTGNLGPLHHQFDDFLMSCCDVDEPNSFAHQLSHEHDPDYVVPSMNHHAAASSDDAHLFGNHVFNTEVHHHDDSMQLDCSMSFGFDEHELQSDVAAGGNGVTSGSNVPIVKQEEELFDMLSAVFD